MNIRQIRKLLAFWVQVLNLSEWKITARWGTKSEMDGDDAVGLNFYSVEELVSTILLDRSQPADEYEHTLVHELLHLVFDGHKPPGGKYDPLHERALNKTATALIKLARMQGIAASVNEAV